jgi:hypothetical protein
LIEILNDILHSGTWYPSALEIDQYSGDKRDGEDLERRISDLLFEVDSFMNADKKSMKTTCYKCGRPVYIEDLEVCVREFRGDEPIEVCSYRCVCGLYVTGRSFGEVYNMATSNQKEFATK